MARTIIVGKRNDIKVSITETDSFSISIVDVVVTVKFGADQYACRETLRAENNDSHLGHVVLGILSNHVTLARQPSVGKIQISSCSVDELTEDINISGSLWDVLFPTYKAIITRSYALTVDSPARGSLFRLGAFRWLWWLLRGGAVKRGNTTDEALALGGLRKFTKNLKRALRIPPQFDYRLAGIDELFEITENRHPGSRVFQNQDGFVRLSKYIPPCSPLLRFTKDAARKPPSRGDYVSDYRSSRKDIFYARDFVFLPHVINADDFIIYDCMADICNILAIRRSGLFQTSMSRRVYTIMLPPGILSLHDLNLEILLVPILVIYRVPFQPKFRPTFNVSFVVLPVAPESPDAKCSLGDYRPKLIDLATLHAINSALAEVTSPEMPSLGSLTEIRGPLRNVINTESLPGLPGVVNSILRALTVSCTGYGRQTRNTSRRVSSILNRARTESQLSSILVQVDWVATGSEANPWERFIRTHDDIGFRRAIHRLMYYKDSLDHSSALTTARTTRFENLQISNRLGDDLGGMTFLDPDSETKFLIYPSSREDYPNYSILRWMGFSLFSDSALTSLRSLLARFNERLTSRTSLGEMLDSLEQIIENFGELYDLEIKRHVYRQEYERLKALLRIDADYDQLTRKVDTLTGAASLREQRYINKLLVILTASTLAATVVTVISSVGHWSFHQLLDRGVIVVAATALLSALGFEPTRRFASRMK